MARGEKFFTFTGPRIEGPRLRGPSFSLTRHGKRRLMLAGGIAVVVLAAAGELSGGSSGSSGQTDPTPGAGSSAQGDPIPETFNVGTHTLTIVNANELQGGGITFDRVYDGQAPTTEWEVQGNPNIPVFPDGKAVADPALANATCKIELAGMTLYTKSPPQLKCDFMPNTGPVKDNTRHHGAAKK